MVEDLGRLAACLEMAAPDIRLKKIFHAEQDHIRAALATVGQYVIEDGGRMYILTATPQGDPADGPAAEK